MKGAWGWAGVAVGVGAFDVLNREQTMTSCYQEALQDPYKRVLALGGMAVTCAHLLDLIPHQYDPFYKLMGLGQTAWNAIK